ncbi:MAG: S9 family peptidase [Pseudoflavonifractor sp.]|nr:S9 family peptidase [Pseudoflavonifractor sp.]
MKDSKVSRRFGRLLRAIGMGASIGAVIGLLVYAVIAISPYSAGSLRAVAETVLFPAAVFVSVVIVALVFKWIAPRVKGFGGLAAGILIAVCLALIMIPGYIYLPDVGIGFRIALIAAICGAVIVVGMTCVRSKWISVLMGLGVMLLLGVTVWFFVTDTIDTSVPVSDEYWTQSGGIVSVLEDEGSDSVRYEVARLYYGSGHDRRPEYSDSCAVVTPIVDGRIFLGADAFSDRRASYWGFTSSELPLNAVVWYPVGKTRSPLVMVVHGDHRMTDPSERGYDWLGRELASRGYVVVSVDENFLNRDRDGEPSGNTSYARAYLLLRHLALWREWSRDGGDTPFASLADMDNIALIGHSRGGMAVSTALWMNGQSRLRDNALMSLDFGFPVKAVVSLAPVASDNLPPLTNIDYLLIHGGHDADVYYAQGIRDYNRLTFTDSLFHFKAMLYPYRANHGQFNTEWGRYDKLAPQSLMLNVRPLVDGDSQRRVAGQYITAFLDASLSGDASRLSLLRDWRVGRDSLPRDYYVSGYADSGGCLLASFEEDDDVTTGTLPGVTLSASDVTGWAERPLPLRVPGIDQASRGVALSWCSQPLAGQSGSPAFTIDIDETVPLPGSVKAVYFSISKDVDNLDFSVELTFSDNTVVSSPLSSFYVLPPLLHTRLSKTGHIMRYGMYRDFETLPQYIEMPIGQIMQGHSSGQRLRRIRFVFDRVPQGSVVLDDIGVR